MSELKPSRGSSSYAKDQEAYSRVQMATGVHWTKADLNAIDTWIARQDDPSITRKVAIRRLVEIGLASKAPVRAVTTKAAVRAAELAAAVLEKHLDPSAPAEEREIRKRRLLKGPSAFREVRVDRPKKK